VLSRVGAAIGALAPRRMMIVMMIMMMMVVMMRRIQLLVHRDPQLVPLKHLLEPKLKIMITKMMKMLLL
jgi:hypothetical protein